MWITRPPIPRTSEPQKVDDAERRTTEFFRKRGIHPTLTEYREVFACMRNGTNPIGIH